ncbi:hypothetical protein T01_7617 [Trichinella spiralis]|uniref:Uncharacterized protein n=1 Tax=Trichinella spiralis TaxID=6334 RepID=A0A0V1BRR9_TRISP|nr:hypothetical protein T01_7617 [Trichinella spiralis]
MFPPISTRALSENAEWKCTLAFEHSDLRKLRNELKFSSRSQVRNIMSRESYLGTEKHVSKKRKRIPANLQGLVEKNDSAAKSMMDKEAAMRRRRI